MRWMIWLCGLITLAQLLCLDWRPKDPIVDIQITVASLLPANRWMRRWRQLALHGRVEVTSDHRPPGDTASPKSDWAKYLCKPPDGHRLTNVHVRVEGAANQRYALLFRDYLRAHPGSAATYH